MPYIYILYELDMKLIKAVKSLFLKTNEIRKKEEARFNKKVKRGRNILAPLGDVEEWYKYFYVNDDTVVNNKSIDLDIF